MTGEGTARSRKHHRVRADSGSASVLVLGVVAALLGVTVGALGVLGVIRAVHAARSAADLAALAAAGHIQEQVAPEVACARARQIARRQGANIAGCVVDGATVTVTTTVRIPLRLLGIAPETAKGRARAGPAPP